jgi:predicted RNA-binding protein YlxR (DUF448 family)
MMVSATRNETVRSASRRLPSELAVGRPSVGRRRSGTRGRMAMRTCVTCRQQAARPELLRLVLGTRGEIVVDLAGCAPGRGAWMHPIARCVAGAPNRLGRALHADVRVTSQRIFDALREAAHQRTVELLSSARRARALAVGAEAVAAAIDGGTSALIVAATDAPAAVRTARIGREISQGRGCAWGTQASLGALLGAAEVDIVAVLESGLADELKSVICAAHLSAPEMGSRKVGGDASTEVR